MEMLRENGEFRALSDGYENWWHYKPDNGGVISVENVRFRSTLEVETLYIYNIWDRGELGAIWARGVLGW